MNISKPINQGNADRIEELTVPANKLAMNRYEDIFDFLSEEPYSVLAQEAEDIEENAYEQILRIRFWNKDKKSYSWSIYAKDRQELDNIIIRKVIWDMEHDKENIKKYSKDEREKVLISWPAITILNKYISTINSLEAISKIKDLDSAIENGIILNKNESPTWEWRDLEMRRLYDWGQVHSTWSTHMKNEEVESKVKILISSIDALMEEPCGNIFSMGLNYSMCPEKYKSVLIDKQ